MLGLSPVSSGFPVVPFKSLFLAVSERRRDLCLLLTEVSSGFSAVSFKSCLLAVSERWRDLCTVLAELGVFVDTSRVSCTGL